MYLFSQLKVKYKIKICFGNTNAAGKVTQRGNKKVHAITSPCSTRLHWSFYVRTHYISLKVSLHLCFSQPAHSQTQTSRAKQDSRADAHAELAGHVQDQIPAQIPTWFACQCHTVVTLCCSQGTV